MSVPKAFWKSCSGTLSSNVFNFLSGPTKPSIFITLCWSFSPIPVTIGCLITLVMRIPLNSVSLRSTKSPFSVYTEAAPVAINPVTAGVVFLDSAIGTRSQSTSGELVLNSETLALKRSFLSCISSLIEFSAWKASSSMVCTF